MDAIDQLKEDVRQGRVDADRLIDVIVSQQRQLEAARQRIEELEKKLGGPGAATPAKVDKPFSMRAPEHRRNQLEHQQRVGFSVGEGTRGVSWRTQRRRHAQRNSES